MVDLPKVSRGLTVVKGPTSHLTAADIRAPAKMLADSMEKLSQAAEDIAVPLAEQAGHSSVRKGEDGQLVVDRTPLPILGKAGAAYDRAARQTYLAQQAPEIETQLTKIRLENPNNPEAVRQQSEGFVNEMAAKAERFGGPALGTAIRAVGEREAGQNYRTSLVVADRLNVANAESAFKSRLSDNAEKRAALARQGGTDTPEYAALWDDANAIYGELQSDARFKFPADRAQRELDAASWADKGEALLGAVERRYQTDGYQAARTLLTESVRGMSGQSFAKASRIEKAGLSWLKAEEAGYRGERDALAREWATAKPQVETLSADVLLDIEARANAIGAARVASDVRAHRLALETVKDLRALPADERLRRVVAGTTGTLVEKIVGVESAGNPLARATTSTAFGLGQFTQRTWLDIVKRNRPELVAGKSDAEILALRSDPALSREMVGQYAVENAERLTAAGVRTDDGALYLAHFLGAGDAIRVLQAAPGTPVANVINSASIAANPSIFGRYRTAQEIAGWADQKMDSSVQRLTGSREMMLARGIIVREMQRDLGQRFVDFEAAVKKSQFPNLADVEALATEVGAIGTPQQRQRVIELAALAQYGREFEKLPEVERTRHISEWDAKLRTGALKIEREMVDTLRSSNDKITKAYQTDPYGASYRFADLKPVALTGETTGDFLFERVRQQHAIRADQRLDAFSVFRPAEAATVAQMLTTGAAANAAGVLQVLSDTLPPDMWKATVTEPSIAGALDGMSRSSDPVKMQVAMTTLDRLWRTDQAAFAQAFKDRDTVKNFQRWQAWKDSHAPAEIAERARRLDDPANAAARKALAEAGRTEAKAIKLSDVLGEFGALFSRPGAPENITVRGAVDSLAAGRFDAEFTEAYVAARETGLSEPEARKAAIDRMKQAWAPSVGAKGALMRHPPEKYYPMVDGSHDWIAKEIDGALAAAADPDGRKPVDLSGVPGGFSQPGRGKTYTFRTLVSDTQTEAEISRGAKPSYRIVAVNNATGALELVRHATGTRFRFDPRSYQDATERRIVGYNAALDEREREVRAFAQGRLGNIAAAQQAYGGQ